MKGLIIQAPWIDFIFEGKKTWEIRGSNTNIRGKIALIKSGTSMVLGTVDLVDSKKLDFEEYKQTEEYHKAPTGGCTELPYKNTHAWVFENAILFQEPVPYKHPIGAVIWVNLSDMLE